VAVEDPVVAKRAQLLRLANLGKRVGYLALAVACVAFVVGALTDLPSWSMVTVVAGMAIATVALVPAIILGYAVAKAEREDPGPRL
jgi:integral membrane sensor domain MASE1